MKKSVNQYNVKSETTELKDLDLQKREVAIYLSKFDTIDADNDMIKKGAFKKSLQEHGVNSGSNRQIAFLRHHDWEHQIGKFTTLQEDENGLFAVGKLGTSTKGDDALRDYDEGIITEHSIGFQYIPDKIKFIDDEEMTEKGYFQIHELILWEGSAVTFGANEHTNVVQMFEAKGINTEDLKLKEINKLHEKINVVIKSIANGRGSDQRFFELEMKLKFLNTQLINIANTNPITLKNQLVSEQTKNDNSAFDWNKINKLLN